MTRFLVLLLAACAPLSTIGTHREGTHICSRTNHRAMRIEVILQDSEHHLEWIGNADPGGHACTTWTLPGDRGRWGYVQGRDTTWDAWFQGWSMR